MWCVSRFILNVTGQKIKMDENNMTYLEGRQYRKVKLADWIKEALEGKMEIPECSKSK